MPISFRPAMLGPLAILVLALLVLPGLASPAGRSGTEQASTPLPTATEERLAAPPFEPMADRSSVPPVSSGLSSYLWTNATPISGASPPARSFAAMAYDATDSELVLFGGLNASGGATLGDTWTFRDGAWTNLTGTLSTAPSPRSGAAMVSDPSEGGVVLFGGLDATGHFLNDTWEFNSGVWTNLTAARGVPAPPRLYLPTMSTDDSDGLVLLCGGDELGGYGLSSTWTWSAGSWTNVSSTAGTAPSPRFDNVAADDAAGHGVLEYGGFNGNTTVYNDTWLFSAGTWLNVTPRSGPSPPEILYPTLEPVGANGSLLLTEGAFVGPGFIPTLSPYTWQWSSGSWTNLSGGLAPSFPPPLRTNAASAEFPSPGLPGSAAVFGGLGASNTLSDLEVLHARLSATATLSPTLVAVGGTVSYRASIAGGVSPLAYGWKFGDGTQSSVLAGTHNYAAAGTFPVSFWVEDALGEWAYQNFTVQAVGRVTVIASASPTLMELGTTVAFTSTVAGGTSPYTYLWSFGDSTTSAAPDPTHTYAAAGSFTSELEVQDAKGAAAFTNLSLQVVGPPTAVITANDSAQVGVSQQFSAEVTGGQGPFSYAWNFEDGGTASVPEPTHVFSSAGTFDVQLTVSDPLGGSGDASHPILVTTTPPVLSVTASGHPSTGTAGSTVFHFFANASGVTGPYQFSWSSPDGGSGAGSEFNHTFASAGTYTVSVQATASGGLSGTSSVQVTVTAASSSTTPPPTPSSGTQLPANLEWALLVAVLLAVVVVAVLVHGRRRRRRPSEAKPVTPGAVEGSGAEGASPPPAG